MEQKKFNVYDMVNDRIIALLDKGVIPWDRPWSGTTLAVSRATGKPYSLLNQFLLSPDFDGTLESLNGGEYATPKQINVEGGRINKGAKSYQVVFWKQVKIEEETADGEKVTKTIPFLRYYNVFNIKDTTLEPKRIKDDTPSDLDPCEQAEQMLLNYWTTECITVENQKKSTRAYYNPSSDTIALPMMSQFTDIAEYYSTAFHETVHSTGHPDRLNRLTKTAAFGNEEYSKEELVAEIGAFALVNMCGIETDKSFKNNVAYIQNWRNAIAKDNKLIVSAAGKAEKAIDRILNPVGKN